MNLFLHYVFDKWMAVHESGMRFARYADDAVVHCSTLKGAQRIEEVLKKRFEEMWSGVDIQEKSKIVCCKAHQPWIDYPVSKFEFPGYEFRLRTAVTRGGRKFVCYDASNQSFIGEGDSERNPELGYPESK